MPKKKYLWDLEFDSLLLAGVRDSMHDALAAWPANQGTATPGTHFEWSRKMSLALGNMLLFQSSTSALFGVLVFKVRCRTVLAAIALSALPS